jgi:ribonuclease HII
VTAAGVRMPTRPGLDIERRLWRDGHRWVAGCDEVGRGAWAGPLSVGVAVVHLGVRTRSLPYWLRDSKMLPEQRRDTVFFEVARWCADAAVGHASPGECDRWGMTLAWRLAARRALAALEVVPSAIVVDGPWDLLRGRPITTQSGEEEGADPLDAPDAALVPAPAGELPTFPEVTLPDVVLPVVHGDARCAAVAAASILAKVVRDRWMRSEAEHFPAYEFEANKGYPSPHHKIALRGYGLSSIHRRSWAFVDQLPWGQGPAPT